jgi:hypothetical protein
MVKTTNSGHQSFTFVLFCWLLAENFKKSAEKNTYEVFMTGGSVFSEPPCTGWKESIGHGSKLKGFLAHIYADLTDLT